MAFGFDPNNGRGISTPPQIDPAKDGIANGTVGPMSIGPNSPNINQQGNQPLNPNPSGTPTSLRFPPDIASVGQYMFFNIFNYQDSWQIINNETTSSQLKETMSQTKGLATITLPLPSELQNSVVPGWEIQNVPIISDIEQTIATFKGAGSFMDRVSAAAKINAQNAKALLAGDFTKKFQFKTANPKKQAFFAGIEPRSFNFNWVFAPQSLAEAQTIEAIVRTFTYYSLPGLAQTLDPFFDFPSTYAITFPGTSGFPIISPCVCDAVVTNYSSATMELLASGHTVQIGLNLTFREMDVRTRQSPGI